MKQKNFEGERNGSTPTSDLQLIIEEKIVKSNGEIIIQKYSKGRCLGKVKSQTDYRVDLHNVLKYRILVQRSIMRLR